MSNNKNGRSIATHLDVYDILGLKAKDLTESMIEMRGGGWFELSNESGLKEIGVFHNKITDTGDKYYAMTASGIASPPHQVTGMKLGTASTAATKNGSASFIGTYISGSDVAIDGGFPSGSQSAGAGYQVQWQTTWVAGVATITSSPAINEVSIVNQSALANNQGIEADSISRAVISPEIQKASGDQLIIIWNHLLQGQ